MTISVTQNPTPILQMWEKPQRVLGAPNGQVTFQNINVAIGASTAERTAILINSALPIGYAYRLAEARILIAFATQADADNYGRAAEGQIIAFNPSSPAISPTISFALVTPTGHVDNAAQPFIADVSSLPYKLVYQSDALPTQPITAQSSTTVVTLRVAGDTDTNAAGELSYYLRFLRYSIAEDELWAIHSPTPVIAGP